jgi:hypothetical protein
MNEMGSAKSDLAAINAQLAEATAVRDEKQRAAADVAGLYPGDRP